MINNMELVQVAFGVRYKPHFALEDNFGRIVDRIMQNDRFSTEEFPQIGHDHGTRQLIGKNGRELITLTREDTVFDSRVSTTGFDSVKKLGQIFESNIWQTVSANGKISPTRYGCLIAFELPKSWQPIQAFMGEDDVAHSEFTLRYSHRIPEDAGFISAGIDDYRTIIYTLVSKEAKRLGLLDYQRYFVPALESKRAREEHAYARFVEKALSYFKDNGWEFLRTKIERMAKAA